MADEPQVAKERITMVEYISRPTFMQNLEKVKTKALDPDRVVRFVLNAMHTTPALHGCTLESMLSCMMTATSLGLEPNTSLEHAWIIPYENNRLIDDKWQKVLEAQFMIGYKGYINLMWRSENLESLMIGAVREHDLFDSYISSEAAGGTFFKFQKELIKPRGDLIAGFTYSETVGQHGMGRMATVLPRDEVEKRRSLSKTYQSLVRRVENAKNAGERAKAQYKLDTTPWVLWEEWMWAKSAARVHASQMPLTPLLVAASTIDTAHEQGYIDIEAMTDPETVNAVAHGETVVPRVEDRTDGQGAPALAGDPEPDQENEAAPAAKKRGRGRPPGSTKAAKDKAAEDARVEGRGG